MVGETICQKILNKFVGGIGWRFIIPNYVLYEIGVVKYQFVC